MPLQKRSSNLLNAVRPSRRHSAHSPVRFQIMPPPFRQSPSSMPRPVPEEFFLGDHQNHSARDRIPLRLLPQIRLCSNPNFVTRLQHQHLPPPKKRKFAQSSTLLARVWRVLVQDQRALTLAMQYEQHQREFDREPHCV